LAGHAFLCWYTDEAATEPFDLDTIVTEAFTLYAAWEEIPAPIDPDPIEPDSLKPDGEPAANGGLPTTGGPGLQMILAVGALTLIAGVCLMIVRRRP